MSNLFIHEMLWSVAGNSFQTPHPLETEYDGLT